MQGELRTESHEYMGRGGKGQRGREGEKGNSVMYIQVYVYSQGFSKKTSGSLKFQSRNFNYLASFLSLTSSIIFFKLESARLFGRTLSYMFIDKEE